MANKLDPIEVEMTMVSIKARKHFDIIIRTSFSNNLEFASAKIIMPVEGYDGTEAISVEIPYDLYVEFTDWSKRLTNTLRKGAQ